MNGVPSTVQAATSSEKSYDTFAVIRTIMVGYPALWLCYLALTLSLPA